MRGFNFRKRGFSPILILIMFVLGIGAVLIIGNGIMDITGFTLQDIIGSDAEFGEVEARNLIIEDNGNISFEVERTDEGTGEIKIGIVVEDEQNNTEYGEIEVYLKPQEKKIVRYTPKSVGAVTNVYIAPSGSSGPIVEIKSLGEYWNEKKDWFGNYYNEVSTKEYGVEAFDYNSYEL